MSTSYKAINAKKNNTYPLCNGRLSPILGSFKKNKKVVANWKKLASYVRRIVEMNSFK